MSEERCATWEGTQAVVSAMIKGGKQNTQSEEQERARFERWISSAPYERRVSRYQEKEIFLWVGQYHDLAVQLAWEAWQEARKL